MYTNIIGLPEGTYFTEVFYSDKKPWIQVAAKGKKITIAEVVVKLNPDFKVEMIKGGFAGHATNNHKQNYVFVEVNHENTQTITLRKDGWKNTHGSKFADNIAVKFYDYNF